MTANPAAHAHSLGFDVAGCRACYLSGSRWPWPGGDPIQEARVRALETERDELKAKLTLLNYSLARAEMAEDRIAELEKMLIFAGIDPNATHMVMPDGSLHRVARKQEAGA